MDSVIVLDFETTGLIAGRDRIIEVGIVTIKDGAIIDTWETLVNPEVLIPATISELTGITNEDVQQAPRLIDIVKPMMERLGGQILVAHSAPFELSFLNDALTRTKKKPFSGVVLDTLELSRMLWPVQEGYSLEVLAQTRELTREHGHRALSDALTTAELYLQLLQRAKQLPLLVLQQIEALLVSSESDLRHFFTSITLQPDMWLQKELPVNCITVNGLVHHVQEAPAEDGTEVEVPEFSEDVVLQIVAADGPLAQRFTGYEERPAQMEMMRSVTRALTDSKHVIVEAGTGTGKSLAYLIPSLLYSKSHGERVVVATHTINLQEQLRKRDVPLLQDILPFSFRISIFKGRNNYVCMRKVATGAQNPLLLHDSAEHTFYSRLLTWLVETESGDREELSFTPEQQDLWKQVASESDTCISKNCPWFKTCYFHKARAGAQQADVIITNHSLVFTDLKADHNVLPSYDRLILDEAHHIEDEATKHLGEEANYFALMGAFQRVTREQGRNGTLQQLRTQLGLAPGGSDRFGALLSVIDSLTESTTAAREAVEELFVQLQSFVLTRVRSSDSDRVVLRFTDDVLQDSGWHSALTAFRNADEEVTSVRKWVRKIDQQVELSPLEDHLEGMLSDVLGQYTEVDRQWTTIRQFCQDPDLLQTVYWLETDTRSVRPAVFLNMAPIVVGPILHERLFSQKASVVLASATLTVNQSFDYAIKRWGLQWSAEEERLLTLQADSPFDYKRQALLCVPTDVASVKGDEAAFVQSLSQSLITLARISNGRMLVLFTSHRMLRETYDLVKPTLVEHGIHLVGHGLDGMSRSRLISEFQRHPKAVLFGASSFWEGVDLPGEDLSLLVIVKLPFWPPNHPVAESRTEALEKSGRNAFMEYSVPQAIVRFKQGFGRLIRTKKDIGAVVVYDRRLTESRYGRYFLQSLPSPWIYQGTEQEVWKVIYNWLKKKGGAV